MGNPNQLYHYGSLDAASTATLQQKKAGSNIRNQALQRAPGLNQMSSNAPRRVADTDTSEQRDSTQNLLQKSNTDTRNSKHVHTIMLKSKNESVVEDTERVLRGEEKRREEEALDSLPSAQYQRANLKDGHHY